MLRLNSLQHRSVADRRTAWVPSWFSGILVIFGFCMHLLWLFSGATSHPCQAAFFWLSGWWEKTSVLQLWSAVLILFFLVWCVKLFDPDTKNQKFETAAQLVLILSLWIEPIATHATHMPNKSPTRDSILEWSSLIFPLERLPEAEEKSSITFDEPLEVPPGMPPKPEYPRNPTSNNLYYNSGEETTKGAGPTPLEIQRFAKCAADREQALIDYELEMEAYILWWDENGDAYNRWQREQEEEKQRERRYQEFEKELEQSRQL